MTLKKKSTTKALHNAMLINDIKFVVKQHKSTTHQAHRFHCLPKPWQRCINDGKPQTQGTGFQTFLE